MRGSLGRVLTVLSLACAPLAAAGCVAAAAAGAGAAVYMNDQGASSLVNGSMAAVDANVQAVFREMGITVVETDTDDDGREKSYHGKMGEQDVHLSLSAESATTTQVNVSVRRNTVDWDRSRARDIVQAIVQRS